VTLRFREQPLLSLARLASAATVTSTSPRSEEARDHMGPLPQRLEIPPKTPDCHVPTAPVAVPSLCKQELPLVTVDSLMDPVRLGESGGTLANNEDR
jgi:hypothetical protein